MDCSIVFSHREESEEKAEMKTKWKTTFLRSVIQYISKGIAPSYTEIESDTTVRVLNQKCNRNFVIRYNESRLHDIAKKKVPAERYVQENDIIINSTGTGTAGRIAQMQKPPCRTTVDSHMIILRGNSEINQRYLGYALRAKQNYILQLDEGTTGQTELNRERLLDEIEITYPTSLKIQEAIATTLSVLDDKIELNRKINENLEQQARAIFKSLFIDNTSIIPATIADVALNITDGVHNTVHDDPEGDFLLLSCKNIKGGSLSINSTERRISKDTFEKLRRRTKLHKGDILISSVGTVGELLMLNTDPTNYEFQRSVAIVKPNPEIVSSAYLYESLVFQKAKLINAAHGAVQQCLFISDIAEFPIGIPCPKELQKFNHIVVPIFDTISANEIENQALIKLRDTLLPRLMSGELDVPHLEGA